MKEHNIEYILNSSAKPQSFNSISNLEKQSGGKVFMDTADPNYQRKVLKLESRAKRSAKTR